MSSEKRKMFLSEVVEIIGGGTPKRNIPDYWNGDIPWLSVVDFNNNHRFVHDSIEKISELGLKNSSTKLLNAGDIVISARGTVGCLGQLTRDMAFNQSCYGLRGKKNTLINDYLYYLLKQKVDELKRITHGAVFDTITRDTFRQIEANIPCIEVQSNIAGILTSIDKKIELNHQINQTLEQMAQAIFKSWFVDFEPVKAKIAALETGGSEEDALFAAMQAISGKDTAALTRMLTEHPDQYAELHTTAELFPSAMQDSELGEIPSGWSVGTLNDLAYLNKNSWSKRTFPPEIDYVDLANTKNGVIETVTKYLSDDAPSRARRILTEDDTIIGTVRPGNRSFAFIKRPSGTLTGSTGFAVLTPKQKASSEFVYIAATSDESINHLAHLADGGAYPAVRSDVVASLTSIIPTDEVLHRFHDLVRTYFECIANLKIESTSLEQTRDALLPKLLSGELAISDYESEVA